MSGTSLAVKVLCFHCKGEQVRSLVGKQRSRMLCSVAKM